MTKVEVEYIRTNGSWTFIVQRDNIRAVGDLYPGTNKGKRAMKRDASEIIKHLRKTNEILIKR